MSVTKRKTRILLVASCKPGTIGGQATAARLLLRHLENEFDWSVVAMPEPGMNAWLRVFASMKILAASLYAGIIKRASIAHLFTSCTRPAMFEKLLVGVFLRMTGTKTILNFRGAFDEYYSGCSRLEKKIVRFLLNAQSVVLCQHNGISDFLVEQRIVPENKIRVIANAVERTHMEKTVADPGKPGKILCLTWIISHKGIDLLIHAAARIIKPLKENNFVIEIRGPEEEPGLKNRLEKQISAAGAGEVIYFAAPVTGGEKSHLLASADIFVLPTRKEGFPNALLEAMAAGLPVITTNKAPMNRIIRNGETGLLFEPENSADLAEQLLSLAKDEKRRRELGKAARNFALENFTAEKIIPRFTALYHELL